MNNVSIDDIKEIENKLNVSLTEEQRDQILREYQRIVMDRAAGWNTILEELILNLIF